MSALLEVKHVSKRFPMGGVLSRRFIDAVVDANFTLDKATARDLHHHRRIRIGQDHARADDPRARTADARAISVFEGKPVPHHMRAETSGIAFMAKVQPVFQNPFEAFNPLKRVDRYLEATARRFRNLRQRDEIDGGHGRGPGQGRA